MTNGISDCRTVGEVVIKLSGQGYTVRMTVKGQVMSLVNAARLNGSLIMCRVCAILGLSGSRKLGIAKIRRYSCLLSLRNVTYRMG